MSTARFVHTPRMESIVEQAKVFFVNLLYAFNIVAYVGVLELGTRNTARFFGLIIRAPIFVADLEYTVIQASVDVQSSHRRRIEVRFMVRDAGCRPMCESNPTANRKCRTIPVPIRNAYRPFQRYCQRS